MTNWTALEYKEISERNLFNCVNIVTRDQIFCLVTADKHHSLRAVDRTRRIMDTGECIRVSINYGVECCKSCTAIDSIVLQSVLLTEHSPYFSCSLCD